MLPSSSVNLGTEVKIKPIYRRGCGPPLLPLHIMPEHKMKGVIHDKIIYNQEEVYIVDPTGTYDPIQRHIVRQHEVYNYVSQKTLEDFNYNLAMKQAEMEEENKQRKKKKKKKKKKKVAKVQPALEKEDHTSQLSSHRRRRQDTQSEENHKHTGEEDELGHDPMFVGRDAEPESSNELAASKHHGRKRRKLSKQKRHETDMQAVIADDVDTQTIRSRKGSEQPSLSAAFRSSQRSQLALSDNDDTSMLETEGVDRPRRSSTKGFRKAFKSDNTKNTNSISKSDRKNGNHQVINVDASDDELQIDNPTQAPNRPSVVTTPKKNQGIFSTSPSTPGTSRSRRKSIHEQVVTPILERREREQSRHSSMRDSPSAGRHSKRRSRSISKDSLFDNPLQIRRSVRLSTQSRTSSPSAQLLSQVSGYRSSSNSLRPDINVVSNSPKPFTTNVSHRKESAKKMKEKDHKTDEAEKSAKKREKKKKKKRQQEEAAATIAAKEAELPLEIDQNAEYEITGLLGDEMRNKDGKNVRFFLVDWKGSWDPTWEPDYCIDEAVREDYFRNKMLAPSGSSDEANQDFAMGYDGTFDEAPIDPRHENTNATRDNDQNIEMGDIVSDTESRNEKQGTAMFKRGILSPFRHKSTPITTGKSFGESISASSGPLKRSPVKTRDPLSSADKGDISKDPIAIHSPKSKKYLAKQRVDDIINLVSESEADQYPGQIFDPNLGTGPERLKAHRISDAQSKASKRQQPMILDSVEEDRAVLTPAVGELADDEASDTGVVRDYNEQGYGYKDGHLEV